MTTLPTAGDSAATGEHGTVAVPFVSFAELRDEHDRLLLAQEGEGRVAHADVKAFIRRGRATGATLDRASERRAVQSYLDYWGTHLQREGLGLPPTRLAAFDASRAPSLDDALSPYVGLEPFTPDQEALFYGREDVVAELVEALASDRLLVVTGSSGSGKSSVVLGGLIPGLRAGRVPGSERWEYLAHRVIPGGEPFERLAAMVLPEGASEADVATAAQQLRASPATLRDILARRSDRPTLIIVDQVEELFTLCGDPDLRQAFARCLLEVSNGPGPEHRVVLTIRSDYLEQLEALSRRFRSSTYRLPPLSAHQLHRAIQMPADRVGLRFEDGLVDRLVEDVIGEPASLPLLQFTLLRLWQERDRNRVTSAAYADLGGGREALANSADALWEKLPTEQQQTVRRLFMRMVRPGVGAEFTSSPVTRSELRRLEAPDRVDTVIRKLADSGLVRIRPGPTEAEDGVQIAHEALIRNWPLCVEWLDKERVERQKRVHFENSAEQWDRRGRPITGLLRQKEALAEAGGFDTLSEVGRAYLRASRRHVNSVKWSGIGIMAIALAGLTLAVIYLMNINNDLQATQKALEDSTLVLIDQRQSLELTSQEAMERIQELEARIRDANRPENP